MAHSSRKGGTRQPRRVASPARADVEALVYRWGPRIDPELLDLSLTHRSFAHENGGLPTNERLEFLGDSVLGIVVTEYLYRAHPDVSEGQLAKMRAATVSEPALAAVARDLGLGEFIKLGKGEALSGGRDKDSILSDTVEALIGATYLTQGLEPTRAVVERLVARFLSSARTRGAGLDWKTSLQELAAAHGLGNPRYEVDSVGPDHERIFTAQAIVDGAVRGEGTGTPRSLPSTRPRRPPTPPFWPVTATAGWTCPASMRPCARTWRVRKRMPSRFPRVERACPSCQRSSPCAPGSPGI